MRLGCPQGDSLHIQVPGEPWGALALPHSHPREHWHPWGKHGPEDQRQLLAVVESEQQPNSAAERPHRQVLSPKVLEGSILGEKHHQ